MSATATFDGWTLPVISRGDVALWSGAAAFVLAAHLTAAWYVSRMPSDEAMSAAAAPVMLVDLAPVMTAPDAVQTEAADVVDSMASEAVDDPVEMAEVPPEPTPVAEPVDSTQALVEPEVVPDTTQSVTPVETQAATEITEAETAEAASETLGPVKEQAAAEETIEPIEEVPVETAEVTLPDVVAALPERREQPARPKPAAPRAEPEKKADTGKKPAATPKPRQARPAPPPQMAATKSAENGPQTAAPRASQAAAGAGVSPARWQSRVNAHLNRFKRRAKAAGSVAVQFVIDDSGRVMSASVSQSSGNAELDAAAVDLVRRASPVPAPPPSIAQARMSLAVPIQFRR